MRTVKKRNKAGMSVATLALGNSTMNAPMTPEIAPLAPTVGTPEPQLKIVCAIADPMPGKPLLWKGFDKIVDI